jgi:hypothetical protein
VKRRTLVLTVIAGLAVFLGVLVLYLPASWFASKLPPQVRCAEIGGSIWRGECLGLTFQNGKLGDATWNLAPARAISGRLVGDVDLRGNTQSLKADLDLAFDGSGELRNVNGSFQMDPAVLAQFPRNQRGQVVGVFKRVVLGAGGSPRQLDGTLELRDFRQLAPRPLALGSYRVTFDGTTQADGTSVGQLRDLGGPFALEGTLTLTAPNAYLVQGFITGRSADAERLVREITLGAPPDASGRSAFSFEGTF